MRDYPEEAIWVREHLLLSEALQMAGAAVTRKEGPGARIASVCCEPLQRARERRHTPEIWLRDGTGRSDSGRLSCRVSRCGGSVRGRLTLGRRVMLLIR